MDDTGSKIGRNPALGALLSVALLGACAAAHAQTLPSASGPRPLDALPDAGALQRSQQQQRDFLNHPAQAPRAPAPVIRDEQEPADLSSSSSTASFVLKGVTFTPSHSHYLDDAQLQAIVKPRLGQRVTYADLQNMVGQINEAYRIRHVLTARAVLPPQRVSGGIVQIQLVEGKLGETTVEGNAITRSSWIENWLGMESGQELDTRELERRLELYNHVNATRLDASLRPGTSFGNTDLLLQAQELPRYQLQMFADNQAARSIGRNEIGVNGAINGILGIGDQLGLYYAHANGINSGALSYSLPVNRQGGRLGLSLSNLDSHVISGPYQDFDVRGRSRNAQLQFSQPIAHLGAWWLDGTLAGGVTKSTNTILGADLGGATVRSLSAGLSATGLYDASTFGVSLTNKYNWVDSDAENSRHSDIWQLSGSWAQRITDAQYTVARLGAQYSSTPLLSSTLAMQMGGSGTVRGYDLGAIAGDSGVYANLEWHHRLYKSVSGFVFTDFGKVRTQGSPSQGISSVGFGLDAALPYGTTLNVTVARANNIVVSGQGRIQITARFAWQIF